MKNLSLLTTIIVTAILLSGCTLGSPFNRLIVLPEETVSATETPVVDVALRPTFTPTPEWTATSSATPTMPPTATPTPLPTDTATPPPTDTPEATATPEETETPTPEPTVAVVAQPPPPTDTPAPTVPPAPQWEFRLAEDFAAPSNANILSIVVAVQDDAGNWIAGYRVVGRDPNGLITKSEPSAPQETGYTPSASSVVKTGNTKFEPQPVAVYITGAWQFHLETADGRQVSEPFAVTMDEENRSWYFFRFAPN